MSYGNLKPELDTMFRRMSKKDFVNYCTAVDGRTRVGGPKGKGRLTAKQALILLGVSV